VKLQSIQVFANNNQGEYSVNKEHHPQRSRRLHARLPLLPRLSGTVSLAVVLLFCQSVAASVADLDRRQSGSKYSPLTQITRNNVAQLELAWEYHTGEIENRPGSFVSFQDEPLLVDGNLIVCTISRRLIALDPATGKERWVYDPETPYNIINKCRGISAWVDEQAEDGEQCKTTLFLGTQDYRLIAIDASTGLPCEEFGDKGIVQMQPSMPEIYPGEVTALSRPGIVNGVVVVGSAVTDDQRVDAPSGRVLAFDARTGEQLWEFDPLPRDPQDPAARTWDKGTAAGHGGGNVWASMSVDEKLDLVYLPTSSASVDFYGGSRPGDGLYADSIVALHGATGEVAWYFQFVHHDVWDYDTPSAPLLIDYPHEGKMVPALVQNTKMGLVFIFDRATGEPLVPIEERPVPQEGAVPEEKLSPTQPFPVGMPAITPQGFSEEDSWGFTPVDDWLCRRKFAELDLGPMYTPPTLRGIIMQPAPAGGPNWGGGAYDPDTHIMVVPTSRIPMIVTMIPMEQSTYDPQQKIETRSAMTFPNVGAPYVTSLQALLSPFGAPCAAPPWGSLVALDIVDKKIVWEVPLGSIDKMAGLPFTWDLGTPGAGAPLVTAGGIVFIGYSLDHQFRAFDLNSGEVLWKAELPAPANSTPVTYQVGDEQYVVVPAGGHSMYGTEQSDAVMAYKLKR
jgi:membrane-bound PQQ-dependent dehydrogenase (glucose/quinate/shikimate family)